MNVSIVIGSDNLGWEEVGSYVVPKTMVKAMPGGDVSFGFTAPGSVVWKLRNRFLPIYSEVKVRIDGEAVWYGRVISDPLSHKLRSDDTVTIDCLGIWPLCSRDASYGYLGRDTDLDRWVQARNTSNDYSGRFTVHKEKRLQIGSHGDRTYPDGSRAVLYYWAHDGLTSGSGGSSRFDFDYDAVLPANWRADMWCGFGGPVVAETDPGSGYAWSKTATGSGTGESFAVSGDTIAMQLRSTDTVNSSAYLRVTVPAVIGLGFDATETPADADYVGYVLRALAFNAAGLYGDIDDTLDTESYESFVAPFPTTIAEAISGAANLSSAGPVEVFFTVDPNCDPSFVGRVRPSYDDLEPRNRHWVVGGVGGEETVNLVLDAEATPQALEATYSCLADSTYPDGTVLRAAYNPVTALYYPKTEVIDLTGVGMLGENTVLSYLANVYQSRVSNSVTGNVTVTRTARTLHGAAEPTWRVRPGDRVTVFERDDSDAFSDPLYVTETSYDFSNGVTTATIGEPWEPSEPAGETKFPRRRHHPGRRQYQLRRGIA